MRLTVLHDGLGRDSRKERADALAAALEREGCVLSPSPGLRRGASSSRSWSGAEHTESVRGYTPPPDPGALTLVPGVVVTSTPTPDQDAP